MISFFIPIRKGSKRIKNKNIKKLENYKLGLTELKIKQLEKFKRIARRDKLFNQSFEYIISTDIPEVINFCEKIKWIKIHRRNFKNSGDYSLQKIINLVPSVCSGDYILWTHVTSPLFSSTLYIDFIKKYLKLSKKIQSQSAFSAEKIGKFVFCNKRKWVSHNQKLIKWPRTQDLDPLYVMNSAAIISKRKVYTRFKDRLCNNPTPILTPDKNGFDIDDLEDFKKVKKINKLPV